MRQRSINALLLASGVTATVLGCSSGRGDRITAPSPPAGLTVEVQPFVRPGDDIDSPADVLVRVTNASDDDVALTEMFPDGRLCVRMAHDDPEGLVREAIGAPDASFQIAGPAAHEERVLAPGRSGTFRFSGFRRWVAFMHSPTVTDPSKGRFIIRAGVLARGKGGESIVAVSPPVPLVFQ